MSRILSAAARFSVRRLLLILGLLAVIFAALVLLSSAPNPMFPVHAIEDAPPAKGSLRISTFGDAPTGKEPALHTSVFVNGISYNGMEDNDLRGHLDGTFINGWNQAGQIHVRAGRRQNNARYGEYEIMRFLQRWANIDLPPFTTIVEARLGLHVEHAPGFPVRLMLYEVQLDWNPGEGGTLRDNVSPPVRGEVWWNDRSYGEQSWRLPGVGYASDTDPEADTKESPLAAALYRPGDETIRFSSTELAAYATERLRAGQPLLFLVKLADYHEDVSGSEVLVYSGQYGDSRNVARRPHLNLAWRSEAELTSVEHHIFVEHGRTRHLPDLDTQGASFLAATFTRDSGGTSSVVEVRSTSNSGLSGWKRPPTSLRGRWNAAQIRVIAARDPLHLGEEFIAELRDTWIRSAPPEEQEVPWRFVSPTGFLSEVPAEYQGDSRWLVRFKPTELGIWHYSWSHEFYTHVTVPVESAEGEFDVVIGERQALMNALDSLLEEVVSANSRPDLSLQERLVRRLKRLKRTALGEDRLEGSDWQLRERFISRLARLERGALQLEDAESFAHFRGSEIHRLLNEIREELGQPVPDSIPLVPNEPPPYARD